MEMMKSMNIDGCCSDQSTQQASASAATARWNPTKEQINMLEGLYKQGIRTPSSEQIQQITSKLKVFGHIEGKNVFYWFQNHKARQRQKQKQETTNLLYFNRFLHHHKPTITTTTTVVTPSSPNTVFIPPLPSPPPPPPPPPHPHPYNNNNAICNQFYRPPPPSQAYIGYYHHQYPINKLPLPPAGAGVVKRRSSRSGVMMERKLESSGAGFYPVHNNRMMQPDAMQKGTGGGDVNEDNYSTITPPPLPCNKNSTSRRNETLELFPVHPTGVLLDDQHHLQPNEADSSSIPCSSSVAADRNIDDQQPFFDFFAGGQQQQH